MLNPTDEAVTASEASTTSCSEAQLAANRANAQHSTGPRTEAGLETSSKNALKTGLTGKTVLLSTDNPAEYLAHVQRHIEELLPVGELEAQLVQRIADAHWRLNRISALERNFYKLGRIHCAGMFESETDPAEREALVQAQTALMYDRNFRNLSIQEARIRRGYEKDMNELKALQSQRAKLTDDEELFQKWPAPWPAGRKNGFEFSTNDQAQQLIWPQLKVIIDPPLDSAMQSQPEPFPTEPRL